MSSNKEPIKPSPLFFLKSAMVGVCLFWAVGVWLLPEKALILKYFRGYMSAGAVPILLGTFVYDKSTGFGKKIGILLLSLGFSCLGAFFALCFYLVIMSILR